MLDEFAQAGALVLDQVPLGEDEDQRPALALHQVGDGEILGLEGVGGVHHQHHHLGEGYRADRVLGRELLQGLVDPRLAPQTGGVDQTDAALAPVPVHRDGVPGDAGFRPGEQAILADQAVDQGGLAGVGPSHDGDTDRLVRRQGLVVIVLVVDVGVQRRGGDHGGVEVAHALAVFGGDRHRLAETEVPGFQSPGVAHAALGLVGDHDHRLVRAAQHLGEELVECDHTVPGVDDEEHDLGLGDSQLGLAAHPRLQALVGDVLEAGGVDEHQVEIAQPPRGELADPG